MTLSGSVDKKRTEPNCIHLRRIKNTRNGGRVLVLELAGDMPPRIKEDAADFYFTINNFSIYKIIISIHSHNTIHIFPNNHNNTNT